MKLTIPTWLTLARIALIPVLVVVYYLDYRWTNVAATTIFVFASITDWLDGWIARRYGLISAFGAFLDPVADKLTVTVTLFLIVQADPSPLMAIVCAVIVGREITISALREWMAQLGASRSVAVSFIGKLKTAAQMVAIVLLLYFDRVLQVIDAAFIGEKLMWIAAVLTLWSMIYYLRMAWPQLKDHAN